MKEDKEKQPKDGKFPRKEEEKDKKEPHCNRQKKYVEEGKRIRENGIWKKEK